MATVVDRGERQLIPEAGEHGRSATYIWNTDTLAWEAATGSLAGGSAVEVTNFPAVISGATVPVTGTFWQGTQPVSGPLTDAELRAAAVPVSGTFWQALQPVEVTQPLPAGVNSIGIIGIDPMFDYDVTMSYTGAQLDQIVITGGGKTKTMTLGWTGANLTSIATVIT